MSALSNIQLKCMITCDPLMKDKIIGVYSADQIKTLDVQKGLIVDTKPSGHEGEHWLAVYNNGGCVEIFDSLGIMSDKSLIDFYKFVSTLRFNIKRIQSIHLYVVIILFLIFFLKCEELPLMTFYIFFHLVVNKVMIMWIDLLTVHFHCV